MRQAVFQHWQAMSGEHRRLAIGAFIIVILLGILLVKPLLELLRQHSTPARSWADTWEQARQIDVAISLDEADWQQAIAGQGLQMEQANFDGMGWQVSGKALDMEALRTLRQWARNRGWRLLAGKIDEQEGALRFSLSFTAVTVQGA